MACRWSRFIFQLPAMSGVRPVLAAISVLPVRRGRSRPGSVLPSRYSRLAPPPVEMWPNCVVGEAERAHGGRRVAAADDGERRRPRSSACATARVPAANGAISNTPIGPFQKTVLASASALGEQRARTRARCRGPSGRPGSRRPATTSCSASARERRRRPRRRSAARSRRRAPRPRRGSPCTVSSWSASSRLLPTSWPWAARKVKTMPPPMSSRSAVGSRLSMTPSLSETFEPPSTTAYGPLRVLGEPLEHLDLGRDEAAGRVRQHAARRRTRWPACGARRRSRRRRRRRRARRAGRRTRRARRRPCWSRPALNRRFSSSATSPSCERRDDGLRASSPTVSVGERDRRVPSSSPSRVATGREASTSASGAPLGRPRWAHDDDAGARARTAP